jgi:hypothetical protein
MRVYVRRRQYGFFAKIKDVSGIAPVPGAVRRSQFLQALATMVPNGVETLAEYVSADRDNSTNILFNSATFVYSNDALAQATQTACSLTTGQMTTLFANAALLPN